MATKSQRQIERAAERAERACEEAQAAVQAARDAEANSNSDKPDGTNEVAKGFASILVPFLP